MPRRADGRPGREGYVNVVLALYRTAPGTHGHVRKADLRLAHELYDRGVPLQIIDHVHTQRIQEAHSIVLHVLCQVIEEAAPR